MRFTARARLETWAHASRVQSDEVTYGLHIGDLACGACGAGGPAGACWTVAAGESVERRGSVEMTDVIERAQAWLQAADERGINVTDENGYLAVISDLVAEVEIQRGSLEGYRNTHQGVRAYRVLRQAVDAMMAPLGYHGTISARDDRVQAVMDALAQIDQEERE